MRAAVKIEGDIDALIERQKTAPIGKRQRIAAEIWMLRNSILAALSPSARPSDAERATR